MKFQQKKLTGFIVVLTITFTGCSIPVRMKVINEADLLALENQKAQFKYLQKEKRREESYNRITALREKKRIEGYNRIIALREKKLKKKGLLRQPKTDEELILKAFQDSGIILRSFEQIGFSLFDISAFLHKYGKHDIDGFCDFLAEEYPFNHYYRWYLDRIIFNPAKRNYELLLKIKKEKE